VRRASLGFGLFLFAGLRPAAAQPAPLKLMILGDSITAGYGLPEAEAWPVKLQAALQAAGEPVRVIGAGVSGDTTAGGKSRLDWALADNPDAVIVALGGNDGLRGLPPATSQANLEDILSRLKGKNIPVLLAGMLAAPNLGAEYRARFEAIYPDLAGTHGLVLYPFFLDGVTGQRTNTMDDGLHPTAKGVERIVEGILPSVESFLGRLGQSPEKKG